MSRIEFVTADVDGELTLLAAPPIPDDAPGIEKEARVRRAIVAGGGACPCGAQLRRPNRAARRAAARTGRTIEIEVWHAQMCPAGKSPRGAA